jgi:hypothetical protein
MTPEERDIATRAIIGFLIGMAVFVTYLIIICTK